MTDAQVKHQAEQFWQWWLRLDGAKYVADDFPRWADSKNLSETDRQRIWDATQPELLEAP